MQVYWCTSKVYVCALKVHFWTLKVYFCTLQIYFCTLPQCLGKEKVVINVYFTNANLLAVGDTTYAYFSALVSEEKAKWLFLVICHLVDVRSRPKKNSTDWFTTIGERTEETWTPQSVVVIIRSLLLYFLVNARFCTAIQTKPKQNISKQPCFVYHISSIIWSANLTTKNTRYGELLLSWRLVNITWEEST